MEYLEIAAKAVSVLAFLGGVVAALVKFWKELKLAKEGDMCLLRAEMLKIYYNNKDRKKIRQYEAQNFKLMYDSYKARGGNSFIDEVHDHVITWELES